MLVRGFWLMALLSACADDPVPSDRQPHNDAGNPDAPSMRSDGRSDDDHASDGAIVDSTRPARPCAEGALDVGSLTRADDVSVLNIPTFAGEEQVDYAGTAYLAAQTLELCLPNDTVSFVLAVDGEVGFFQALDRGEGTPALIDASSEEAYYHSPAQPSWSDRVATLQFPSLPEQRSEGAAGPYRATLGLLEGQTSATVWLTVRRGRVAVQSRLRANMAIVDGALTNAADRAALDEAIRVFQGIYRDGPGIEVEIAIGRVDEPQLLAIEGNDADFRLMQSSEVAPMEGQTLFDHTASTILITRDLLEDGAPYYGVASGAPGFLGFPSTGTILGLSAHRNEDGTLNTEYLGVTLGHELGHFLGLAHTSEDDGTTHDALEDTPECTLDYDADGDQQVAEEECQSGGGGDNIMFWSGWGHVLSPSQLAIMQSSPGVLPR